MEDICMNVEIPIHSKVAKIEVKTLDVRQACSQCVPMER